MLPPSLVVRLAGRLHAAWQARAAPATDPGSGWPDLDARLADARRARDRVRLAAAHHRPGLVPRLTDELTARLADLARQVEHLRAGYTRTEIAPPDLRGWVGEVRQLEAEFGAVEVRWADRVVRVVTDPIVLAGVPLGAFAIDLGWDRAGQDRGARAYEAVALDPHPPTGRADVTHPHVQAGAVCPGDAAVPLRHAVAAGRLVDAFLLVRSVLTTYNPGSAYVPLAEWDGIGCGDCGRRVGREDQSACGTCDSALCEDCAGSCAACAETRCGDCREACAVCREDHCRGTLTATASDRAVCPECLAACGRCGVARPTDELTAGTRLCPTCDHEEDDQTDDHQPVEEIPAAVPTDAT